MGPGSGGTQLRIRRGCESEMERRQPVTTGGADLSNHVSRMVERFAEWIPGVVWRYRRELRPLFAAVVLWSHLSLIMWLVGLLTTSRWAFAAGAIATIATGVVAIRQVGSDLSGRERTYVQVVGGLATAWSVAAWTFGSFNLPMAASILLLGVAATVPWAWRLSSRRSSTATGRVKLAIIQGGGGHGSGSESPADQRSPAPKAAQMPVRKPAPQTPAMRAQGQAIMERFAAAAKQVVGEVDVKSIAQDPEGAGWTMHVQRPGLTVAKLAPVLGDLESHMDSARVKVRVGALQVFANPNRASLVQVRFLPEDPLTESLAVPLDPTPLSITKPLVIGLWDDITAAEVLVPRRHVLVGGMTGAGKSAAVNLLLFRLGMCVDVVIWGIDLKNGIELGDWRPRLDRLGTTPAEAVAVLRDARRLMDRRGAAVADMPRTKEWPISAELPQVVIVIDEYSQLPAEAKKLAEEISQLGRAQGVQLLIATQKPLADDVGSILPSQCTVKFALHVAKDGDGDVILGQGHVSQGWRAARIGSPGYFLMKSTEHSTPNVGRFLWLSDVERAVELTQDHRPSLNDGASTSDPLKVSTDAATVPGPDPVGADAADKALRLLEERYPEAVTFGELLEATGATKDTLNRRLRTLVEQGQVEKARHGAYRVRGLL